MHSASKQNSELDSIKSDIINQILLISVIILAPSLLVALARSFDIGWQGRYAIYIFDYFLILGVYAFRKKINSSLKIVLTATVYASTTIVGAYHIGIYNANFMLLVGIGIMSILFNRKFAILFSLFFGILLTIIGYAFYHGILTPNIEVLSYNTSLFVWISHIFLVLSCSLIFLLSLGRYYYKLEEIIRENVGIKNELKIKNENLEDIVNERTKELTQAKSDLQESHDTILKRNQDLEKTMQELKAAQEQLVQAEKMASLGTLTSGIAHEIKNPLNFISGSYHALDNYFKQHGSKDEKFTSLLLKSINEGVTRADNIVTGLNKFSRDNSKYDEDCKLHEILDNCLLMLNNQLKNRIEITKNYFPEEPVIKGNVGKLHQVFINILTNANHAIKEEGSIHISTSKSDSSYQLVIEDSGHGIKKELLNQITDPFFTTKAPGVGTGLGLSISYSIITEHKGNMHFESEEGKGTKVILEFPIES